MIGDVLPMALALLSATSIFATTPSVRQRSKSDGAVLPRSKSVLVVLLRGSAAALAISANDIVHVNALLQKTYLLDRSKRCVAGLPVEVLCLYLIFSIAFHSVICPTTEQRGNNALKLQAWQLAQL